MGNDNKKMKWNIKDSVFTCIFCIKKNSLKLYKALNPSDNEITEDDLKIITLKAVLVNGLYNDLGLLVNGTLIIMIEAQSTWSENIVVRLIPYLGETLSNYFKENNISLYNTKKVKMPNIELYVIYTGNKKVDKDVISLNESFYDNKGNIDIKVKVISKDNVSKMFSDSNIVTEYIKFADMSIRYEKEYGRSKETVVKIINDCIKEDILKEFMMEHKKEVIDIMDVLYDEKVIMESYENELRQEGIQEGMQLGMQQGMQQGMEQGMQQLLIHQFKEKKISAQEGADYLNISVNEFLDLIK